MRKGSSKWLSRKSEIADMVARNLTDQQMAEALGVSPNRAYQIRVELGIAPADPNRGRKGKPPRPPILEGKADRVAALKREGCTDAEIAERFGCRKRTVADFRKEHGIEELKRPVLAVEKIGPMLPIHTYFDEEVNHLVKVYPARRASGDLPVEWDL